MSSIDEASKELKAVQDEIERERIRRARGMTLEERLKELFELSNHQFGMMLAGAMHRLGRSPSLERLAGPCAGARQDLYTTDEPACE